MLARLLQWWQRPSPSLHGLQSGLDRVRPWRHVRLRQPGHGELQEWRSSARGSQGGGPGQWVSSSVSVFRWLRAGGGGSGASCQILPLPVPAAMARGAAAGRPGCRSPAREAADPVPRPLDLARWAATMASHGWDLAGQGGVSCGLRGGASSTRSQLVFDIEIFCSASGECRWSTSEPCHSACYSPSQALGLGGRARFSR